LVQNGNEHFGVDAVENIIEEHASLGDIVNLLGFVCLKNRGNNQYDCLDSISLNVFRVTLPLSKDTSPASFPVVAKSFLEYITNCDRNSLELSKSTLADVNPLAVEICELFSDVNSNEV